MEGTTKSGFKFKVSDDIGDNFELLELLCDIEEGSVIKNAKLIRMVLGDSQTEKLKAHVKKKIGRVSSEAIFNEITEIFNLVGAVKN